ncbi:DUF1707 SHOCT-like domain-containing protein [Nocardia abscessus]|uniref:DUF1707 SHOCT-like domain-containing protein n=1 Tax=Nocardia abscessus TaxID=120957 RepID=UPI002458DEC0|nr:DUF1707 domain-containing protein [Nocardia abscessus]
MTQADSLSQDHVRASDADREKIVDQLRLAMNEGRLTLPEFDERLQQVYAAIPTTIGITTRKKSC